MKKSELKQLIKEEIGKLLKEGISGRLNWESKLTPEQENILDQNNLWHEMDKIFHEIEYDTTDGLKQQMLFQFTITNVTMDTWDGEIPEVINVNFEVQYKAGNNQYPIDYLNATFKFAKDGYLLNYDYA